MSKLGFGVIGVGGWGETHVRVYAAHPFVDLVALCDVREDRAQQMARQYGVQTVYTDYRDLLGDERISAVSIVTPDFAHTQPAIAAARAGKHVLIEKPLATTVQECEQIIAQVDQAGIKLMVDFHNRWSPPFAGIKASLDQGELGDPAMIYFRLSDTLFVPTRMLSWAAKSSLLWFLGSHCVDMMLWLLKDEVRRVYSASRSRVLVERGIATPDFFQTVLEFAKGTVATMENCWILPETSPNVFDLKFEIVGTRGSAYVDGSHHRMFQRFTADQAAFPDVGVAADVHGRPTGFGTESIRHFVDCVLNDRVPMVTAQDGLRATKVVCAIERSAKEGKVLDL